MATQEEVQKAINDALEADRAARVAAISVKLPQFWPDKAKLWFAQAEAQFETKGITVEKTKYAHVVTMLDSKTAEQAMDIIETPPTTEPYTTLKNRLTKAYSLSDSEKAGKILDMSGLGDRTPSQFIAHMLQLVPTGQEPGFLFREVFLRQLPTDIRRQLAQTTKTGITAKDLRELAEEADRYFSSTGARVNAVTDQVEAMSLGHSAPIDSEPSLDSEGVFAVSSRGSFAPRGDRGGFGSRGRGSRGTRNRYQQRQLYKPVTFCYYHAQFGTEARQCLSPCGFQTTRMARNNQENPNQQGNGQAGRRE